LVLEIILSIPLDHFSGGALKSRSWEVDINGDWDVLKTILSEPERILPLFPYFKELKEDRVRFEVPRFIFNFGYEFELGISFGNSEIVYTFRGRGEY
jgi:hypothetical protein